MSPVEPVQAGEQQTAPEQNNPKGISLILLFTA
jgi:hypothetical protein